MNVISLRFLSLSALILCLNCGCSKSQKEYDIPMPAALSEADPLISKLITQTANKVMEDKASVDAWVVHSLALLANGYYEESVQTSKIALEINPIGRTPLRYRQAFALWQLNQQDEAISQLKIVLIAEPTLDFGWRRLAKWQFERGEFSEAELAINNAWQLNPKRLGTLAVLVQILLQQDQAERAISRLAPRLNKEDTPPYLYLLASQAYRQLGETESMQAAAAKGKRIPPTWPDPWLTAMSPFATGRQLVTQRAVKLVRNKGQEHALPFLEKAFQADPANGHMRGLFAIALMSTKQEARAFEIMDGIEDLSNAGFQYWTAYANLFLLKAEVSEDRTVWLSKAMDCFVKAEAITKQAPELYRLMGKLANEMNNSEAASMYYRTGAELLLTEGENKAAQLLLQEGISLISDDRTLEAMLAELMKTE